MTITITLTATSGKGANFNSFMTGYFKDFSFRGWPYILGGSGEFKGNQIVLLDDLNGRNTKAIVLDGRSISYDLAKHVVSGTLTGVRLGTLGSSYTSSGEFLQDSSGRIAKMAAQVQISGLSIAGTEFHSLISGLMGGVSSGHRANPAVLNAALADEAHNLIGSSGGDTYTGTRFSDRITGNGGNDVLLGAKGNDRILGSAGNDKLTGGGRAQHLGGGPGAEPLIFTPAAASKGLSAGRDTAFVFPLQVERKIRLLQPSANTP